MSSRVDINVSSAIAAHKAVERLWFLDAAINNWQITPDRHVVSIDVPDPGVCAHELERALLRAQVAGVDVSSLVEKATIAGDDDGR